MELDKYISDLLYRYDCVILPNLGAFIANKIPTQILASENKIIPPTKEIIFNRHIKNNDGLLVHYLMNAKKLSYKKAEEMVSQEIDRIINKLDQGEQVVFSNVGSIKKVDENNIEFSVDKSVNYLKSSYGFATLNVAQISTEKIVSKKVAPIHTISERDVEQKVNISSKIMRYAAMALPFITLASLAYFHQLNEFNLNLSAAEISVFPVENIIEEQKEAPKTTEFLVADVKEDIKVAEEIKIEEVKQTKTFTYHLIAGAFAEQKNALKAISKISSKGLKADIIAQKKNGWYLVAYSSHENITDAKKELKNVKLSDNNSSAWIWKKKIQLEVNQ